MDAPHISEAELRGTPEPNTVGICGACGGDIYEYELTTCECGATIHITCRKECLECGAEGCRLCMIYDNLTGEHFCNTSGPGQSGESECRDKFIEDTAFERDG